jgi:hypothetical protein
MATHAAIEALARPFPADAVSWRVGSRTKDKTRGMALAYIDARDVMERLDTAVGPANWRDEYQEVAGFLICKLWLRINGEWVWKCDGAGKTDVEAEKGMVSDSFKRAAVKWGIGRYLYNLDSPWVAINEFGQIEKGEHSKLRQLLTQDMAHKLVDDEIPHVKPAQQEPKPMQSSDAAKVVAKVQETFPGAQAKTPNIPAVRPAPAAVRDAAGKRTSGEIRATTQAGDRRINPQVSTKCANTMLGRLSYCESAEELAVWDERDGMNHADWGKLSLADQRAVETAYRAKKAQLSAAPAHDPDTGEIDEDAA